VEDCSLAEVISVSLVWWTATAKAKAVVGLALALRFAHSLGLLHRCFASNNILFDPDVSPTTSIPRDVPQFISKIIEAGLSSESKTQRSFRDIFEALKRNDFEIMADVDSEEVLAFARWIESAEQANE
jgi:serine/threonine protein kinase